MCAFVTFHQVMTEGNRMSWGEALYLAMAVSAFVAFIGIRWCNEIAP